MERVRCNEIYTKEKLVAVHVKGVALDGTAWAFTVPEEDFDYIGTSEFNERIKRLIDPDQRWPKFQ